MKLALLIAGMLFVGPWAAAEAGNVWDLISSSGEIVTQISFEPAVGDEYITADNRLYHIISVSDRQAQVEACGTIAPLSLHWKNTGCDVSAVMAVPKRAAIYCTHSDESYQPSDGYYTTRERGSIYQVAQTLASELSQNGIDATVSENLHHPHDAGAYRRSRQTAVELLKTVMPDCLIDLHRDGIPDPDSYTVIINGKEASKIRLLVGRGNQNADVNREFALIIKAVADEMYPHLIKDIYMGKGTFNQDLLPQSILLECGTYTLEKECVLASMPMMANVLAAVLQGDVLGSVIPPSGGSKSEANGHADGSSTSSAEKPRSSVASGGRYLGIIFIVGFIGMAVLSAGSRRGAKRKVGRNLSEMTGGIIGNSPEMGEDPHHS